MRIEIANSEMFTTIFEKITSSKINRPITGISNDSRKVKQGDLYIALEGENTDGHNFLTEASKKGANAALVNHKVKKVNLEQIIVSNPLDTIAMIANRWRRNFDIPIIAITGSNGKTSTKDLLAHVLIDEFKVLATKGNYNTLLGLCLTMFELRSFHEIAILELGASKSGEIEALCKIAEPTHGIITNIASAHLEGFGSLENIAREKGFLFKALENGIAFVNMADKYISQISILGEKITYGLTPECDFPADIYQEKDGTLTLILDTYEIPTNSHNFSFLKNCIPVSAISITLGIKWDRLAKKLQNFSPPLGRCFVNQKDNITIIDDTYNANLASSIASLEYLNAFSNDGRKIFVFGDMLELGQAAKEQHQDIGTKCSDLKIDIVFTIGEKTIHVHSKINDEIMNKHFKSKTDLIKSLKAIITTGDKILFKGSRGMKMEKIIEGVFET
ncbi:MAG: hypothetical protein CMG55_08635 [Candidatus Marinimicrobia bacterium]|nr:hypothetical protein [Candidatus Neomarinimicrobiota bacterium]